MRVEVDRTRKSGMFVHVLGRNEDPDDNDLRAVHLRIEAGNYATALDGKDDDGRWRAAAGNAAKKLKDWILVNREQLLSHEQSPSTMGGACGGRVDAQSVPEHGVFAE